MSSIYHFVELCCDAGGLGGLLCLRKRRVEGMKNISRRRKCVFIGHLFSPPVLVGRDIHVTSRSARNCYERSNNDNDTPPMAQGLTLTSQPTCPSQ
eukprot:scaffold692_cov203-Alexandrium_tamarense.AAC.9